MIVGALLGTVVGAVVAATVVFLTTPGVAAAVVIGLLCGIVFCWAGMALFMS